MQGNFSMQRCFLNLRLNLEEKIFFISNTKYIFSRDFSSFFFTSIAPPFKFSLSNLDE